MTTFEISKLIVGTILSGSVFWLGWIQFRLKEKIRQDELFDRRFDFIKRFQTIYYKDFPFNDTLTMGIPFNFPQEKDTTEFIEFIIWYKKMLEIELELKLLFGPEMHSKTFDKFNAFFTHDNLIIKGEELNGELIQFVGQYRKSMDFPAVLEEMESDVEKLKELCKEYKNKTIPLVKELNLINNKLKFSFAFQNL